MRYWSALPDTGSGTIHPEVGDVGILNAKVFQALQLTNRMEHAPAIAEALEDGDYVVADRYWQSGWVYGQADGLDPEWLVRIQAYLPQPDLNLLLDIEPGQSTERRPERRDRYEEQEGLMEKVAHLYRRLWREKSKNNGDWVIIDGRDTIDGVHRQIVAAVETHCTPFKPWRAVQ